MKSVNIKLLKKLDYAGEEALNTICTNLTFSGRDIRKIVVTSNTQSEGKSWMTMHIAQNLASRGRSVVLVDGDLRRSFLVKRYGIEFMGNEESYGLAHLLSGQCALEDAIYATNIPNVCLVPVGRDVSNPVALIDTPFFRQTLDVLAGSFDFVIVDAPPIGMVIDAAEIATSCDGTVMLVEYKKTRLRELAICKKQMEKSGTPVLGCIINKVNFDSIAAKKYYNKTYYSQYSSGYYRRNKDKK